MDFTSASFVNKRRGVILIDLLNPNLIDHFWKSLQIEYTLIYEFILNVVLIDVL